MLEKRYQKNIFQAAFFLLCGVPGVVLFLFGTFGLMYQVDDFFRKGGEIYTRADLVWSTLSILLGGVLLLLGIGKIKEWLYLFVFISFPFLFFLVNYISVATGFFAMLPVGIILSFVVPFIVSRLIKKYYDNKRNLKQGTS